MLCVMGRIIASNEFWNGLQETARTGIIFILLYHTYAWPGYLFIGICVMTGGLFRKLFRLRLKGCLCSQYLLYVRFKMTPYKKPGVVGVACPFSWRRVQNDACGRRLVPVHKMGKLRHFWDGRHSSWISLEPMFLFRDIDQSTQC